MRLVLGARLGAVLIGLAALSACRRSGEVAVVSQILAAPDDGQASRFSRRVIRGEHLHARPPEQIALRLVPGILVRLADDAELVVGDCRLGKDGEDTDDRMEKRSARCSLLNGSACFLLSSRSGRGEIEVNLPESRSLHAHGETLFTVKEAGAECLVTCVRGTIEVQMLGSGEPLQINGGYFCQLDARGATWGAATENATAQQAIVNCLSAQTILERLSASVFAGPLL
ncbi:MAG: hypothetical protein ABI839_05195 [Verrucomicrobiota bacterium]